MTSWQVYYVLGAFGDGYLYRRDYLVAFTQKEKEWLQHIQHLITNSFDVRSSISRHGRGWELRIYSKKFFILFSFLARRTNELFTSGNKEEKLWFIGGFLDAEGYITSVETYKKTHKLKVSFHQNDKTI